MFLITVASGCLALGALGALLRGSNGLPWRFGPEMQVLVQPDQLPQGASDCMNLPLDRVASGDLCRFGPDHPGVRTAVLWGDSHALVLLPAFERLGMANDVQIRFAGRSACRPLRGPTVDPTQQMACTAFNEAMLSAVRAIHPEVTVLAGFWDQGYAHDTENRTASPTGRSESADDRTIGAIDGAGSALCVVLDVPRLPYAVPYALAVARRRALDTAFVYVRRSEVLARYADFERPVRALATAGALKVVDPKDTLCAGAWCSLEADGHSLYRDSSHLSRAGSLRTMPALEPCLRLNAGQSGAIPPAR